MSTTMDLVRTQLDDVGHQLSKVIEGVAGDQWSARLCPESMSPRETVGHLCECYTAVQTMLDGREHEWGTFALGDVADDALPGLLAESRQQAVNAVVSSSDPKAPGYASDYMVLHDAYHVGQLASLRLHLGGFDPYSIYKHG